MSRARWEAGAVVFDRGAGALVRVRGRVFHLGAGFERVLVETPAGENWHGAPNWRRYDVAVGYLAPAAAAGGQRVAEWARRWEWGFLGRAELEAVGRDMPHALVLVRCGAGRFVAPAAQVGHFLEIVRAEGRDYVRDVSLWEGAAIPAAAVRR